MCMEGTICNKTVLVGYKDSNSTLEFTKTAHWRLLNVKKRYWRLQRRYIGGYKDGTLEVTKTVHWRLQSGTTSVQPRYNLGTTSVQRVQTRYKRGTNAVQTRYKGTEEVSIG
jgi:hypothetical protein